MSHRDQPIAFSSLQAITKMAFAAVCVIVGNYPSVADAQIGIQFPTALSQSCALPMPASLGPLPSFRDGNELADGIEQAIALNHSRPLDAARFYAAAATYAERNPNPRSPYLSVSMRGSVGVALAQGGQFEAAVPFLRCAAFSPGAEESQELWLVQAVAARDYVAAFAGRTGAVVQTNELRAAFEAHDKFYDIGVRVEKSLDQVALQYGAGSVQYATAERLSGAGISTGAPQLGFPEIWNANSRLRDRDIDQFILYWNARLSGDGIVPFSPVASQLPEGTDLGVFTGLQEFESRNQTKAMILLGRGDAIAARNHATAVASALAPRVQSALPALQRVGRDDAFSDSVRSLVRAPQQWLQDANDYAAGNLIHVSRLSQEERLRQLPVLARLSAGDPDTGSLAAFLLVELGTPLAKTPNDRMRISMARVRLLLSSDATSEELERSLDGFQQDLSAVTHDRAEGEAFLAASRALMARREGRYASALALLEVAPSTSAAQNRDLASLKALATLESGLQAPQSADIIRAFYPPSAVDCAAIDFPQIDADLREAAKDFPGLQVRRKLCALESDLETSIRRSDVRSATGIVEHMAVVAGRNAAFHGWRISALYDAAASFARYSGNNADAFRLANAALSERTRYPNSDMLRLGRLPSSDLAVFRARLASTLSVFEGANAGRKASLLDDMIASTEAMPTTSATRAIRTAGARLAERRGGTVRAYLQAEAALEQARQLMRGAVQGSQFDAAVRTVAEAQAAFDRAKGTLQTSEPLLAATLSASAAPLATDIQRVLRPHEAVLVIGLFPAGGGYAIVLKNDRATMVGLPADRHQAILSAKTLRDSITVVATNPGAAEQFPAQTAYDLYRQLVSPAEDLLEGVDRLTIIPDPAIDDIPFAALLTRSPTSPTLGLAELADAPWLVKRTAIQVQPSLSAFLAIRRAPPAPRATGFLGIGDPILSGASAAAAIARGARRMSTTSATPIAYEALNQLEPLPETANELRTLGSAFPPPTALLTGSNAREGAVVSALQKRPYAGIAFSTHALVAGSVAGLSEPALVVTPNGQFGGSPNDDGLLTLSEIAGLNINAALVILSACDTASGDGEPAAETLSGLARGFYSSGIPAVVASYWPVASIATSRLMGEAAQTPLQDPAASLRASQLRMIALSRSTQAEDEALAHPYYWAAFAAFAAN